MNYEVGLESMDGFQVVSDEEAVRVDSNGVEAELFDDPAPVLDNEPDYERLLSEFVEFSERLEKGKKIISEVTRKRNDALQVYLKAKESNLPYQNRNEAWETYAKWKTQVNAYWDHWKSIREEQNAMATKYPRLWPLYFKLRDSDLLMQFQPADSVEVDEQTQMHADQNDVADELAESHIAEQAEYDRDVKVDWSRQDRVAAIRKLLQSQNAIVAQPEQMDLF